MSVFEYQYVFGPNPDPYLAVDEEVDTAMTGEKDSHGRTHIQAQEDPGV